jgi:hypothetical protein
MALSTLRIPQLTSPEAWIQWFNMVKATAMDNDVWDYCDPDGDRNAVRPSDPTAQATAAQERLYGTRMNEYERIRKGLAKVNTTIQGSVCEDYQTYLEDAYTPRQRLISLRQGIKPSLRQIEDNVRDEYESLIKGSRRTSTEKWLNRWIALGPRLRAMDIPNLSEAQACKGFIRASEAINPAFFNSAMQSLDGADRQLREFEHLQKAIGLIKDQLPAATSGSQTIGSTPERTNADWQAALNHQFEAIRDSRDPHKLTLAELVSRFKAMEPSRQVKHQQRAAHATFQGRKHKRDKSDDSADSATSEISDKAKEKRK